ncbi:uncharacterized protein [Montipora foliosa]|uniref:uncharacterized protein n=1 Tax=Montipora foliosa TaxID=591990 RepID=UPI0035F1A86F
MDGSIPIFKAHKTPVESCEESLEEIEKQASLLFEEFLRIPQPAGRLAAQASSKRGIAYENNEADEDDMVPDNMQAPGNVADHTPVMFGDVQGSPDPKIQKLALQMQQAGDALYKQYERRVEGNRSCLVHFVLENAANLTYDRLCKEIDSVVGKDRNWANFAMAMFVGKRVVMETSRACSSVSQYFSNYIGQEFSPVIQQAGGMESFVRSGQVRR